MRGRGGRGACIFFHLKRNTPVDVSINSGLVIVAFPRLHAAPLHREPEYPNPNLRHELDIVLEPIPYITRLTSLVAVPNGLAAVVAALALLPAVPVRVHDPSLHLERRRRRAPLEGGGEGERLRERHRLLVALEHEHVAVARGGGGGGEGGIPHQQHAQPPAERRHHRQQ